MVPGGYRVPGCQGVRVPGGHRCQVARVPGCQGARCQMPGCQMPGARLSVVTTWVQLVTTCCVLMVKPSLTTEICLWPNISIYL